MEGIEISSTNLISRCEEETDHSSKLSLIMDCITQAEETSTHFSLPETCKLFEGAKWINCEESPRYTDLSGRLVLLDFFTYCCINCIHIIPFLHNIESKYPASSGLMVIGVHSAKFPNEKLEKNIKNAVSRYDLQHPVINDCDMKIWEEFSIKCWPTLVLISPTGKVLFSIPGESHQAMIGLFIDVAMEYYQSKFELKKENFAVVTLNSPTQDDVSKLKLKYPGKVSVDELGERIAISDGGNNRVIISDCSGKVLYVVGKSTTGFVDGSFEEARFNSPQGVTWHGRNAVFVADCNNHAIRKIDLFVKRVITVCGTGTQGSDLDGGKHGLEQQISSPWDVQVGGSPRFPDAKNILYIAMSGTHQLWAFFLKTADFQKGMELEMGICIRYAGNGNEENRNNTYPHKAGFAQPSGLTVDEVGHMLYVADSESSTIRKINLANGAVQALVGGDIDPTNLFAFGDTDGKGRDVKLQHPVGVVWDTKRSLLYVADTYNHKIKVIDSKKKTCQTLKLEGKEASFNEPSGLALDPNCESLYIADTNNHDIKVMSLKDSSISQLDLTLEVKLDTLSLEETDGPQTTTAKFLTGKNTPVQGLNLLRIHRNQSVRITLKYDGFIVDANAPSSWQVSNLPEDNSGLLRLASGKHSVKASETVVLVAYSMLPCPANGAPNGCVILIESVLYHCLKDSGVCKMRSCRASLPVEVIFSENHDSVHPPVDVEVKV